MTGEASAPSILADADSDLPRVQALQQGDDAALDALMSRHREALFRFVYRYVLNHETAADLVQETFVRAYFNIGRFRPNTKFVAWLYRIALNLCRDHARSAAFKQAARTDSFERMAAPSSFVGREPSRGWSDAVSPEPSPAEAVASSEEVKRLQLAISGLPHDLKTALILSALEGRSHKDCAELLETSPKAVETRVYRARQILAKRLQ